MFTASEGSEVLVNAFQNGMQAFIAGIEERKNFDRLDLQRRIAAYYQYGIAKENQIEHLLKVIDGYVEGHNEKVKLLVEKEKSLHRANDELNSRIDIFNSRVQLFDKKEKEFNDYYAENEGRLDQLRDMLKRQSVDKVATLQMLETMTLIANYYSALNGQNIVPAEDQYKAINQYWEEFERTGRVPKDNYIIKLSEHITSLGLKEKTDLLVENNQRNAQTQNSENKQRPAP